VSTTSASKSSSQCVEVATPKSKKHCEVNVALIDVLNFIFLYISTQPEVRDAKEPKADN